MSSGPLSSKHALFGELGDLGGREAEQLAEDVLVVLAELRRGAADADRRVREVERRLGVVAAAEDGLVKRLLARYDAAMEHRGATGEVAVDHELVARVAAHELEDSSEGSGENVFSMMRRIGRRDLIETIKEGTGPSPKLEDNVKVNYRGTLIDGTFFDGTEKYGEPSTFKLSKTGLIGCWNEALTFMKVGGKAKVYCPPDLAYGDRPNGEIPAGATLLFDLELLEIVK